MFSIEEHNAEIAAKDEIINSLKAKINQQVSSSSCCCPSFLRCTEHRPKRHFIYVGSDSFDHRRKQLMDQNPLRKITKTISSVDCKAVCDKYNKDDDPLQIILDGIVAKVGKGATVIGEVVSVDKEVVSFDKEVVVASKEVVSVDKEVVVAGKEVVSVDKEVRVAGKDVVSVDVSGKSFRLSLSMPPNPSSPPCVFNLEPPQQLSNIPLIDCGLLDHPIIDTNNGTILSLLQETPQSPVRKYKKKQVLGSVKDVVPASSDSEYIKEFMSALVLPVAHVANVLVSDNNEKPVSDVPFDFYKCMGVVQLKEYCRTKKFKGFSKYTKKEQLIEFINSQEGGVEISKEADKDIVMISNKKLSEEQLQQLGLKELRAYAKNQNIKKYSKLTKTSDLVKFILENQ